jgi:tetratricopeptide (TPR) repeat protein
MRRCLLACVVVAALASTAVPVVAPAQTPPSSPPRGDEARDREARAEYIAGSEAFTRGDFEQAVRRFEHAYALSGRPQLLYNIGTSYDRLHRWQQAHRAFEQFLRALPESSNRDEVRARQRVIEAEIARERQVAANQGRAVLIAWPPRVIVRHVLPDPPHTWRIG